MADVDWRPLKWDHWKGWQDMAFWKSQAYEELQHAMDLTECSPLPKYRLRYYELCPLFETKAVFIGPRTYEELDLADGLLYSHQPGIPRDRRRLMNIALIRAYEEYAGLQMNAVKIPSLVKWARSGVLLMHTRPVLPVDYNPRTKRNMELWKVWFNWDKLTINTISAIGRHRPKVPFVLFGVASIRWTRFIQFTSPKSNIIQVPESSVPLKRELYAPISEANIFRRVDYAIARSGGTKIDWRL